MQRFYPPVVIRDPGITELRCISRNRHARFGRRHSPQCLYRGFNVANGASTGYVQGYVEGCAITLQAPDLHFCVELRGIEPHRARRVGEQRKIASAACADPARHRQALFTSCDTRPRDTPSTAAVSLIEASGCRRTRELGRGSRGVPAAWPGSSD